MTGEMTLTGQVLPVGGLKEKSLAAQRAGIKRIIVPERNEGDVAEIPEHERGGLEFIYVDRIDERSRSSEEPAAVTGPYSGYKLPETNAKRMRRV